MSPNNVRWNRFGIFPNDLKMATIMIPYRSTIMEEIRVLSLFALAVVSEFMMSDPMFDELYEVRP
jgi:hypothetical protein